MLFMAFFSWWYVDGWKQIKQKLIISVSGMSDYFSVPLLIKTLFKPWKRIITPPGNNLAAHFQALIDNTISRFIGFSVRILVLLGALISLILLVLLGTVLILVWPLMPAAVVVFIIMGIV